MIILNSTGRILKDIAGIQWLSCMHIYTVRFGNWMGLQPGTRRIIFACEREIVYFCRDFIQSVGHVTGTQERYNTETT